MTTPWPALERNSALRAIPSVWREFMGGHFETFQAAFFHKLPEPSQGFFCERCYCTHEVITYGPEAHARALADIGHGSASLRVSEFESFRVSIFAACRCTDRFCPDIPLTPADLEVWALNWPKLARALCQAFGLNSRFADLKLLNTYQIGVWSSDAVPVILTIQSSISHLQTAISHLALRLRRPFILLAPTSGNLDAIAQEFLANCGAGFFPLDASVHLDAQRGLRPARPPGELFARFTPQPRDLEADTARKAYALAQALDAEGRMKAPTPFTVFCGYCIDGSSAAEIAKKHRVSKLTVLRRLKLIEARTGADPESLRRLSPHLEKIKDDMADSRAAHIHGRRLIYDGADGDEAED